jgi:hypothetical protein
VPIGLGDDRRHRLILALDSHFRCLGGFSIHSRYLGIDYAVLSEGGTETKERTNGEGEFNRKIHIFLCHCSVFPSNAHYNFVTVLLRSPLRYRDTGMHSGAALRAGSVGELQPLRVERLLAWIITLVVSQRLLHQVSYATSGTTCGPRAAYDAFARFGAAPLPFGLA